MAGECSKHRLKFVGFLLFWDKNHVVSSSWFIEEEISSRTFLREKEYLGRNSNERRLEKSNTMESPQSGSQVSMSETASVAGTVSSESSVGRTPSVSATPESIPASTPAPVPQPKSQPPKRRGKGRYRTYKFVWIELRMFRISFCNFNVFSYLHFQEDSFAFFFNISSLSYTETIWFYQVDLISTVVMHQMTTKWQNSHIYSHKFNLNKGVHKIQVIHPMLTFWISRSTLKFCIVHISIWWFHCIVLMGDVQLTTNLSHLHPNINMHILHTGYAYVLYIS